MSTTVLEQTRGDRQQLLLCMLQAASCKLQAVGRHLLLGSVLQVLMRSWNIWSGSS